MMNFLNTAFAPPQPNMPPQPHPQPFVADGTGIQGRFLLWDSLDEIQNQPQWQGPNAFRTEFLDVFLTRINAPHMRPSPNRPRFVVFVTLCMGYQNIPYWFDMQLSVQARAYQLIGTLNFTFFADQAGLNVMLNPNIPGFDDEGWVNFPWGLNNQGQNLVQQFNNWLDNSWFPVLWDSVVFRVPPWQNLRCFRIQMTFTSFAHASHPHFDFIRAFGSLYEDFYNPKQTHKFWKEEVTNEPCLVKCYLQLKGKGTGSFSNSFLLKQSHPDVFKAASEGKVEEFHRLTKIPIYIALAKEFLGDNRLAAQFIYLFRGHSRVANKKLLSEIEKPDKQFKLQKKKRKEEDECKNLFFLDIETIYKETPAGKDQIPWLIFVHSKTGSIHFWGKDCVLLFITWLSLFPPDEKIVIWTFNGSRFDLMLLIKDLSKFFYPEVKGTSTNIKILTLNGHIHFYDLKLIYAQGSLKSLAKLFNLPDKGEFDYNLFTEEFFETHRQAVVDYCENDCVITMMLYEKMQEKIKQIFKDNLMEPTFNWAESLPSLTMRLYKEIFQTQELLGTNDEWVYDIERSSYFGGITLNLKKLFEGPGSLYYYDINSSYPYAMLGEMPIKLLGINTIPSQEIFVDTNLYEISYHAPTCLPGLPTRMKTGLCYFQKGEKQWHWGCAINLLLKYKKFASLVCHTEIQYEAAPIFRQYMHYLYEKRTNTEIPEEKYWYKLLMNSFYGKFGQRDFDECYYIPSNCVWEADILNPEKHPHIFWLDKETIRVSLKTKKKNHIGRMVRIASYITAVGRTNLLRYIYSIGDEKVYYCDTDSFISETEIKEGVGKKLGELKLEEKIIYGEFIAPKLYTTINEEEKQKFRAKGVKDPKQFFVEKKKTIYNEGTFKRRWGGVTVVSQEKIISAACNRRIWKDNNSFAFESSEQYLNSLN